MVDRVGDFAQHQRLTQALLTAQTRARLTQTQISSGKIAEHFRDLAPDAERLLGAKTLLQRAQQFQGNSEQVAGRLQVMESAVSSLHELATRLRVLLMQRLNDGSGVPGVVGTEAQLMLEETVNSLNTSLHGRYLFAGSRTDTPPVALDPAFADFGQADGTYYQGDALELTVRADEHLQLTYGMTADREGFHELIGAMRAVMAGDAAGDRALLEDALDLVNAALPKLADYQSELGARQARLEEIALRHGETTLYLQRQISEIENVDVAEAITRLAQDQMLIESALATIGRLSQLSLVDFLR